MKLQHADGIVVGGGIEGSHISSLSSIEDPLIISQNNKGGKERINNNGRQDKIPSAQAKEYPNRLSFRDTKFPVASFFCDISVNIMVIHFNTLISFQRLKDGFALLGG